MKIVIDKCDLGRNVNYVIMTSRRVDIFREIEREGYFLIYKSVEELSSDIDDMFPETLISTT